MAETANRRRGRTNSICYGTLRFNAFVLFMFSLISFSSLAYLGAKISRRTVYGNATYGYCILYAHYNETTTCSYPLIELGRSKACGSAIFGEIVLALFGLVFVFVLCVKAALRREASRCDIVVELALHVIAAVLAFLIGMVLSSGLRDTCRAVSQTQNGTCNELVIPEPDSSGNSTSVAFYRSVKVSEATAWLGWVTLVINIALYVVWMCMICVQQERAKEDRELLTPQLEKHGHDVEDGGKTA